MEQQTGPKITKEPFGKLPDGTSVDLYTLTNVSGVTVKITNYGGIVTSILTPDGNGELGDIVLGFDTLEGYLKEHPYFGAIIGRYGNRIAKGKFTLDGKTYTLAINNGPSHLHGGLKGFDKVVWDASVVESNNEVGLKLTYVSKDGEEGYPGNLSVTVNYTLTNNNELVITYDAETDKTTPLNLTNHSYFNLAAGKAKNCLDHIVKFNADRFVEVNDELIPTGNLHKVADTPMDFTHAHPIGDQIAKVPGGGYDHTFVISKADTQDKLVHAAWVHEPTTNRVMDMYTTQPGFQFYTGNFLDGSLTGKYNIVYDKHYAFCWETQHFPDSPNQPSFPSTWLHPGEKYHHVTTYRFSTAKSEKKA